MKKYWINLLITFALLCCHCLSFAKSTDLQIQKGQQQKISIHQPIQNVWIENSKILEGKKNQQGTLTIKALKKGYTRMRINDLYYNVNVTDIDEPESFKIIKNRLRTYPSLQLIWTANGPTVTGELLSFADWQEVAELFAQEKLTYLMAAKIENYIQETAQAGIQKIFSAKGLPFLKIQFSNWPIARIHMEHPYSGEIEKITKFWGIELIKSHETLPDSPQIRVNLILAEVKKSEVLKYGTTVSGVIPFKNNLPDLTGFVKDMHALHNQGKARVLASPTLFCRSGKEAEFFAGGEFPIKVFNSTTHDVLWKKYGVILKIKPTADFTGRMSLHIATEVSALDIANSVDGIPAVTTNKLTTHFDLQKNQTIMLSGLIKSQEGISQQGLPGLKNLPILGPLFSSRDWLEERSELVVLVQPEFIVEPL